MSGDRLGLPAVLADIAEVAGLDAARLIAATKGGQVVYIPSKPKADNWLVELVGPEAATSICRKFSETTGSGRAAGRRILIPMARVRATETMARAIEAGGTNNRVASLAGTHERTVRRHRSRMKTTGLGPLFD